MGEPNWGVTHRPKTPFRNWLIKFKISMNISTNKLDSRARDIRHKIILGLSQRLKRKVSIGND